MGGWIFFLQLWEMWSPSFGIPTGTQVSGSLCYKFVILIQLHVQMATISHLLSVVLIGHMFICTGSYPKTVVQVQWPNIVLLGFLQNIHFYNKYNLLLTYTHPVWVGFSPEMFHPFFFLNRGDPVLQLLEHTDFGSTAVLSVLSTFNRAARKIQQVTWFWYHVVLVSRFGCRLDGGVWNHVRGWVDGFLHMIYVASKDDKL